MTLAEFVLQKTLIRAIFYGKALDRRPTTGARQYKERNQPSARMKRDLDVRKCPRR